MKKDTSRTVVVAVLLLAIYTAVVMLIPFEQEEAFWISYVFTVAAFLVATAAVYIAFNQNPDARSRFYGFPIARIGVVYCAVQVAVSLLVMALGAWIPYWIPLVVYLIGLGAALLGLISAEAIVNEIQEQDQKLKDNTVMMRALQSKISQIASQTDDAAIQALAEEFRYSDPVSNEAIVDAEADLAAAVDQLQSAFVDGDKEAVDQLCRKSAALLAERNRLCKLNKGR